MNTKKVRTFLQVINVSRNWLQSARPGSLSRCSAAAAEQLIIYDLSDNRIRTIASDDLKQLVAVRQLLIANNQIENINRQALSACALLQYLHLGNNSIEEIPALPETLISVNAATNRLSIIPQAIANLPNLLSLNLSGNAIDANTPFPVISPALQTADLSHNRLEFIPENLFSSSSQQLRHLLLSYNRITQLEPAFFQNYSQLLTK
ncbi:unnamed protein product [Gongylonema pulchrum]|uniref:Leucine-rich repeat domain-containing protein n=1 Tax=Gongylonema pulchrum TaxID=637853 RepID=A0A183CW80_9BILA|nr:unnamed protein product [Gongylonema pulchrum]